MLNLENIRTYYKNQVDLSLSLRTLIDHYFSNDITEKELENVITEIISANEDKFYTVGKNEIAYKPAQILGKTRLELLEKLLNS